MLIIVIVSIASVFLVVLPQRVFSLVFALSDGNAFS